MKSAPRVPVSKVVVISLLIKWQGWQCLLRSSGWVPSNVNFYNRKEENEHLLRIFFASLVFRMAFRSIYYVLFLQWGRVNDLLVKVT